MWAGLLCPYRARTEFAVLYLSDDLPIMIEIIDSAEYIEKFLPFLDLMVKQGLVTVDDVEVIKYDRKQPSQH